jgi:hypothetical protein
MTTTIWIPDVHNKWRVVERILARHTERPLHVIMAGDYFDNFDDTMDDVEAVGHWLGTTIRRGVMDETVIWTRLLGNHDIPYIYPHLNKSHWCPGYTPRKALAVAETRIHHHPQAFKLHTWVGPWLLTHAGVSARLFTDCYKCPPTLVPDRGRLTEMLTGDEAILHSDRIYSEKLILMDAGWRMEERRIGGVTWCDWDEEFRPLPDIKQLVGHTPGREPRYKVNSICGDTHLRYYAIYNEPSQGWYWYDSKTGEKK